MRCERNCAGGDPGDRARRRRALALSTAAPLQIHAHRGGAGLGPENTCVAVERSVAAGAHWIELDVQTCGSGHVVVILDPDLGRLAGQPDAIVAALGVDELQSIDVGSHFSTDCAGARVPTLWEVVETFRGRVRFHVEVKEYGIRGDGTAARAAALLAGLLPPEDVLVTSYNPFALARVARAAPALPRGLIHPPVGGEAGLRRSARDRLFGSPWAAGPLAVRALVPRLECVDAAYVQRATARGLAVLPWAVNERSEMERLRALGVAGIVTDRPDLAARAKSPLAQRDLTAAPR